MSLYGTKHRGARQLTVRGRHVYCQRLQCIPCASLVEVEDEIVKQENSLSRTHYPDLDAQIELERKLANLEQKACSLRTEVNYTHSPIVRILLPEIMSVVFICWMDDDTVNDTSQQYMLHIDREPWVMGWICSTWRTIAWNTPQLWSSIDFRITTYHTHRTPSWNLIQQSARWLSRSGQLPLSIKINAWPEDHDFYAVRDIIRGIIELVNTNAHRLKILEIHLPPHYLHLFCPPQVISHSNLEWLRVIPTLPSIKRSPSTRFDIGDTFPSLRRMEIRGLALTGVHIDWSNLTRLDAKDIVITEAFEILKRAARLTKCNFVFCAGDSAFAVPESPVVHHQLQSFSCTFAADVIGSHLFFATARTPRLEDLHIQTGTVNYIPFESVVLFLSACSLTRFSLVNSWIDREDLLILLRSIPTLRRLDFDISECPDITYFGVEMLYFMCDTARATSPDAADAFLPHLETLAYSGRIDFDWTDLLYIFGTDSDDEADNADRTEDSEGRTEPLAQRWRRPLRGVNLWFDGDEDVVNERYSPSPRTKAYAADLAGLGYYINAFDTRHQLFLLGSEDNWSWKSL